MLDRVSLEQVRSTDSGQRENPAHRYSRVHGTALIGGLKVIAKSGWFAASPSGTEDIYKIYAEIFRGAYHLRRILEEAQAMGNDALAATPDRSDRS